MNQLQLRNVSASRSETSAARADSLLVPAGGPGGTPGGGPGGASSSALKFLSPDDGGSTVVDGSGSMTSSSSSASSGGANGDVGGGAALGATAAAVRAKEQTQRLQPGNRLLGNRLLGALATCTDSDLIGHDT